MTDDKTKRWPHDGKRIDVNDPNERHNWCKALQVSPRELIDAVKAVGTSAKAVREYLGK